MEKFKIDFLGKSYNAVEINGECVSDDNFHCNTIVLAENSLDDVLISYLDGDDDVMYNKAKAIDVTIFGFAPNDLILNGDEEELEQYAKGLL